jgi:hypothetical protein
MQAPAYPVFMLQFQYPPQPMENGTLNHMKEQYAGPRDRVFSFDSVSSINIGPSDSPAASHETQAQNVQVSSTSDNASTSDTQSTDAPSS